jgi:hypothetical protein
VSEQSTILVDEQASRETTFNDENEAREPQSETEECHDADTDPELLMDAEEFEYLWNKRERFEQECHAEEEISRLMHEQEDTYRFLKEAGEQQEQERVERLKNVDYSDEEEPEDYKQEIDRVDEIEHFMEKEEQFRAEGKSEEEIVAEMIKEEGRWEDIEGLRELSEQHANEVARICEQERQEHEDLEDRDEQRTHHLEEGFTVNTESAILNDITDDNSDELHDQESAVTCEEEADHEFFSEMGDNAEEETEGVILEDIRPDDEEGSEVAREKEGGDVVDNLSDASGEIEPIADHERPSGPARSHHPPELIEDGGSTTAKIKEQGKDTTTREGDEGTGEEQAKLRSLYHQETEKSPQKDGTQTVGFNP